MFDFNKLTEGYVRHYNRLFWLFFVIAGALFVSSVFLGVLSELYIEIVLGFLLVVVGIHRTGEEFLNRRVREAQDASIRTINELLQWAEKSYDYTRAFKERHEKRLFHLDERRADLESKLDEQFRLAVKKIIDLENRMNKGIRIPAGPVPTARIEIVPTAPVPAAKPAAMPPSPEGRLTDLSRSQLRAIQFLRKRRQDNQQGLQEAVQGL
ncbi:MAG: hypothetical protein KAT35_01440 [Candidatus Aenigmarchaeota archaeon]|nr:hypothetical protein [Candidatus Aenigmarchaeota archaeon]